MAQKVVLIGSEGLWGKKHRDLLIPKADNGEIELFLIDIREEAPTTRGIQNVNFLHWNSDADQIAGLGNLDTVILCCPDRLHLSMAQAFTGRCKVLYIEKPLSDKAEELAEFQQLLLLPRAA